MQSKRLNTGRDRIFAVVFSTGDDFKSGMLEFARQERLTAAHFTAIGALEHVKLAWFNPHSQQYETRAVEDQLEVLTLAGNIAEHQGQPKLHAHAVLGRRDFSTLGGHLVEARVRPTLEVIVTESPLHLHRRHDATTGLALIRLDEPDLPPRPGRRADAGTRRRRTKAQPAEAQLAEAQPAEAQPAEAQATQAQSAENAASNGDDGQRQGVGLGLGFAINKPEGATDWKQCPNPNCQVWVHGIEEEVCPNCGYVFSEAHVAT
jgi:predicted DNA-binding protein with PD1-like motif